MKKIHMAVLATVLSTVFCATIALAQDRHFSQFYSSPLTLNPALTGAFDGKYRVGGNYRDQWRGLLDQPYQTFSFGSDLRLNAPFQDKSSNDKVGIGLLFYRDIVNQLDFSTTQLAVSVAYHKSMAALDNNQYLSLGFQLGLTQRNVNYDALTFQDQWNGITGYTLPRGERLPENNFGFADLSTGLNYSIVFAPKTSLFIGAAYHHFNRPNVAFFTGEAIPKQPLLSRFSAQIAGQFPINEAHTLTMSPRLFFATQGEHLEFNVGTNFRTIVDKTYGTALHFGSWVRPVKSIDGITFDAVVLNLGLELNNILLGFSYDINLPNLKNYRRTANTFEISLIYLGEFENDELLCPSF
jgi:type IX secretion system PorP/SprF family membrane protein